MIFKNVMWQKVLKPLYNPPTDELKKLFSLALAYIHTSNKDKYIIIFLTIQYSLAYLSTISKLLFY